MNHGSGLDLERDEAERWDAMPPWGIIFVESPAMRGWGDIVLESSDQRGDSNVGWYERADADRAAEYWDVEVEAVVGWAPRMAGNRREP